MLRKRPQEWPESGAVKDLTAFYRRVVGLGSVIFILVVAVTVGVGWRDQHDRQIRLGDQRVRESAMQLEGLLKVAPDEVQQLRSWAEAMPDKGRNLASDAIRSATVDAAAKDTGQGFTLDALSRLPESRKEAQMLALRSALRSADGRPSQAELATALASRFADGQKTYPYLRWSYYFAADKDLLAVSPFAPSSDVMGGEKSIPTFLRKSWTYDITTSGLPKANPKREIYWTPGYPDQAGAGLMVSVGAPVYWGNRFVGIVGTDVLLKFLGAHLDRFPDSAGSLLLVSSAGQVLGERGPASSATAVPTLAERVPGVPLDPAKLPELHGQQVGDRYVFTSRVAGPDWDLAFIVPASELQLRTLRYFLPQLALSLALILAVLALNVILRRMYVAPALGIAGFVEGSRPGAIAAAPRVPRLWRPWVSSLEQTIRDRYRLMQDLAEANEVLETRVTERTSELAEQRTTAQKQSALLRAMFESMNDGVILLEDDGRLGHYNRAARTLLGHGLSDVPAGSWASHLDLRSLDGNRPLGDEEFAEALLAPEDVASVECTLSLGGESPRTLAITSRRLRSGEGTRVFLVRDVTAERARQQELERFAGTVAHDLKGPLTALNGWAEAAAEELAAKDLQSAEQALQRTRSAGGRMRQVIDDWLAYTVTREGILHPGNVSLADISADVVGVFDDSDGASFQVDTPHRVYADEGLVRQLLANLVGNSVKYTRDGVPARVVVRSEDDSEPGWIRVRVCDEGTGIQPGEEEKIFGEFHRSSKDAGRRAGAGLGLALCRSIVVRHGGEISASPNHPYGTTIEFTLPAA